MRVRSEQKENRTIMADLLFARSNGLGRMAASYFKDRISNKLRITSLAQENFLYSVHQPSGKLFYFERRARRHTFLICASSKESAAFSFASSSIRCLTICVDANGFDASSDGDFPSTRDEDLVLNLLRCWISLSSSLLLDSSALKA
jgi:hypothetical protein